MTPRLLVLADDLTGAADCAARCRSSGLPAAILVGRPRPPLPAGAVAFTSDSRHLSAPAAAARVSELLAPLAGLDAILYKKIDSTLRGNLGAELDAMLDLLTARTTDPIAVVSPAFPAQGRGLAEGYLVHAGTAPRTLHLPTLLAEQSRRPVALIRLEVVRTGAAGLAAALAAAAERGTQIVVDALSDEDLTTLYQAVRLALPHALLCGSAGLAGVTAAAVAAEAERNEPGQGRSAGATDECSASPAPCGRVSSVLVVVGSGSSMAHRQMAALRRRGDTTALVVEPGGQVQRMALGAAARLLLHLPPPAAGTRLDGPSARAYAAELARTAVELLQQRSMDALVLVGGDTAIAVLARLGVEQLTVIEEMLPGMPLSEAVLAGRRPIYVLLKAGNHGDEQTLSVLLDRLQQPSRSPAGADSMDRR